MSQTNPAVDMEAAALHAADLRGYTGSDRQIYAAGHAQGFAAMLGETTNSLEALAAGGYTPAQQARADALNVAARALPPTPSMASYADLPAALLEVAGPLALATWIYYGDPTTEPHPTPAKSCTPPPCPPMEEASLTVTHRIEITDDFLDPRGPRATCICGWTSDPQNNTAAALVAGGDHLAHHETHCIDIEGNFGDTTRRPTCTCGWTGKQYTILAEAMAAGTQHVRDSQT